MVKKELVIVANRLPLNSVIRGGVQAWEPSPGGLVSAMKPVLEGRDCAWIGWPGSHGASPAAFDHDGIHYVPVPLSEHEHDDFYEGFSNRSLWPLYHDALRTPEYHRGWWRSYVDVNKRFANEAAEVLVPEGTVWVHDYHLQLVPRMLRQLRPDARIAFFMHIPFPPAELFAQLPWRRQILQGLLGADVVGFQTPGGAANFTRLCQRFHGAEPRPQGLVFEGHEVRVGSFPISVDVGNFETLSTDPALIAEAEVIRGRFSPDCKILLGVDRLDYTKGIDQRLRAFETFLTNNPDLANQVVFIQVAVPSRQRVAEYADMRTQIEQLVGHINGRHADAGIVPVHYLYRNLEIEQLVPYYLAADVMVVTPFRDGMNLVSKEYVACRYDDSGVLVLSEFTGSALELDRSLLVNPHDIDGLAATFEEALRMSPGEARRRMAAMRTAVRGQDVYKWAENFLSAKRNPIPA